MSNILQRKRTEEIDFLKCFLIISVIVLHIVYITNTYPIVHKLILIYTMPVFTFISGYLVNVNKKLTAFVQPITKLLILYLIAEGGYIVMAHHLPTREYIDVLSPEVFLQHLLLHPIGLYWYLHTLIICNCTYYITNKIIEKCIPSPNGQKGNILNLIIALGTLFTIMSVGFDVISAVYAAYYVAGVAIKRSGTDITKIFHPTWLILIPIFLSFYFHEQIECLNMYGIIFNGSIICLLFLICRHTSTCIKEYVLFIGKHTLPIYIFSLIFTFCANRFSYLFSFD
ncbi:MAG: acyltransferase [Prevotellaceae bacterium]|nr:acyltransferase [Prevotellaceae bacterium]